MSKQKPSEDDRKPATATQTTQQDPDARKAEDRELTEQELSTVTGGAVHQLRKKYG